MRLREYQVWRTSLRSLAERGKFRTTNEILYTARITPDSLSGAGRRQQEALAALSIRALEARQRGESEEGILAEASQVKRASGKRRSSAEGCYFIGEALRRNRDERALRYLRRSALLSPLSPKAPDRIHRIDLTGSMKDYVWGLNGVTYDKAKPFVVAQGERVELILTNKTMMSHPMHLHGHFFQVTAVNGQRFPGAIRDTVLVPPKASVTVAFDADNPGKWLFHCHILYHQASGMMGLIQYQGI